jgi:hypothetical protein
MARTGTSDSELPGRASGSIPGSSTEKCPVQMVFSLPDWVLAGTPRKGTLRPRQQATLRREGEFSFESYFALILDSPGVERG